MATRGRREPKINDIMIGITRPNITMEGIVNFSNLPPNVPTNKEMNNPHIDSTITSVRIVTAII
jgi:hypothetical protein